MKKLKRLLAPLMVICICLAGTANALNIRLVKIGDSKTSDRSEPNEPSIAVNPLNNNEIVIGANAGIYYCSKDGGLTWTDGVLSGTFSPDDDPIVIADDNGSFYYFHQVAGMSVIKCHRKNTIDDPWTAGSSTARNGTTQSNRDFASFDPLSKNLYVTWSQYDRLNSTSPLDSSIVNFSRSEDQGSTWSPSVRVSVKGGDSGGGCQSTHGACNTIGPNGEVYVSWWGPGCLMYFNASTDQGKTWLAKDITN